MTTQRLTTQRLTLTTDERRATLTDVLRATAARGNPLARAATEAL